jgi:NADH-quinone oxidoreductase E subunit
MISNLTKEKIKRIKNLFPHRKSAILPALHEVINDMGYTNPEIIKEIANLLDLSPLEVSETASFYTFFPKQGTGKYLIQICTNLSCSLLGAESLVRYLEEKLKIKVGQTTPDGKFTLITVECLGSCGTAPVMQINQDYYENLTKEKIDKILDELP